MDKMKNIKLKPLKVNLEGKLVDMKGETVEILRFWALTNIYQHFTEDLRQQLYFKDKKIAYRGYGGYYRTFIPRNIKRILREGANAYLLNANVSSEYKPIQFFKIKN